MRVSKPFYFMEIATVVAKQSTCPRRQVGCVIIDHNDYIVSTGYNGVPRNMVHCIDEPCGGHLATSGNDLGKCQAIHAEQNALLQCANINSIKSIFCTTFPCIHCAKMIMNTSCEYLYYAEDYSDREFVDNLFEQADIETIGLL